MFNVYFKEDGKLGKISASEATHVDAINAVEISLTEDGANFTKPVLAVIQGGKQ